MRRLHVAALIAVTIAILIPAITSGQFQQAYVPGQVIVKLRPTLQRASIADVELTLGSSLERRFPSIGAELWNIGAMSVEDALERFRNDSRFEYIEPNYILHADATFPNDPRFSELWGLHNTGQTGGVADADIDAPEAWDIETGDSVLVGVIDTGTDWTHEDLAAQIYTNPGEIPNNGIDDDGNGFVDDVRGWDFANNDNNPMDDNGHGTHVSGTIAAVGNNGIGVVGVSWSARILPIKFLSGGGSGTTANAILSVEYATMMGVRATNNSWGGGGFSQALKDAIQAAGNVGILFVAAAGNSGLDTDLSPHYPSAYNLDNIISVASTTHNDLMSGFSNFGATSVDLGAPGSDILSSFPGNTYGVISGTSMATPHVTGAVSLLWAAAPSLSHLDVKSFLMDSGDPIPALAGKTVSGKRLNVFNALSGLDSIPPAAIADVAVIMTGSNTATLSWTATGDDTTDGTAAVYDVRYALAPIDAASFAAATPATGEPAPQPAGATETFQVTGLDFATTYYFAVVAVDEQANTSGVSNSPSGTTLGIPQIVFAPDSLSDSLLTGGMSTQIVTIRNTADGTLDFSFPGLDPVAASPRGLDASAPAVPPVWLHAVPNAGRILAGDSMQVEMRFDATGLFAGNLLENVTIANNDPAQPAPTLVVMLNVTGAPDISASTDSLNYGAHFIGAVLLDTLTLTNVGTDSLHVSGIAIDNGEFTADPGAFALAPLQSSDVAVTFSPVTVGVVTGTLTVSSDDPDTPGLLVALTGEGLVPPQISVSPDSLQENLVFGQTSTQTLTIENLGGSDLIFELQERLPAAVAASGANVAVTSVSRDVTPLKLRRDAARSPVRASGPAYATGRTPSREPLDAAAWRRQAAARSRSAAAGLRILLVKNGDTSEIRAALMAFPDVAVVDEFDGGIGTPTLTELQQYDAAILAVNTAYANSVAMGDVLADYADAGGGVIMTLASFVSGWDVRGRFQADGFYPFTLGSGPGGSANLGTFDAAHPIMQGVTGAFGDLLGVTNVAPGAQWVADWDNGAPLVATQGPNVAAVNVFVASAGFWTGDVPLILKNAAAWVSGGGSACWLSLDPTSGVVPALSTAVINVTFEAISTACVTGGDFTDTLVVVNNDPLAPEVTVPVHLHVTGAPDIAASDSLLDYGTVFVGVSKPETLTVSNVGTDTLHISGVSTDNPHYSVIGAGFTLSVGATHDLIVSFAPPADGPSVGTLSVMSDDPDTPLFGVALSGAGLMPPEARVYPDSLSDSLFTGAVASKRFVIGNFGGSDLVWSARVAQPTVAAAQVYALSTPTSAAETPDGGAPPTPSEYRSTPIHALLDDLTGVEILWDRAHGQGFSSGWSTIIADLTLRGATVTDNTNPITPALLANYTVFWTTDLSIAFTASELAALHDWVIAGGSLLLEGDNTSTVPIYNSILSALGAGIVYSTVDGASGTTSNIFPHQTTQNVFGIFLSGNIAHISTVVAPANPLIDDITNRSNTAYSELGGGRVIAMADEVFHDTHVGLDDNQLFANQAFDWLSGGVRWLSVTPKAGVDPPDSLDVLDVVIDATGLVGGGYDANIIVSSNDPFTPAIEAPVHLHVTGAPDIALSDSVFDFGPVFLTGSATDTLTVTNVGTDLLTAGFPPPANTDFTVSTPTLNLNPGESGIVLVTFAPSTTGPATGTLFVASNDPDKPLITIPLQGEGLLAPVIGVNPDSLSDSLFTGGMSTQQFTISNAGGSDLTFDISAESMAAVAAAGHRAARERFDAAWKENTNAAAGPSSTDAHASSPIAPQTPTITAAADSAILVIQDKAAWSVDMAAFIQANFGLAATVITSSQIPVTDFSMFSIILTVGDQLTGYYDAISANVAKFESFAAAGGVVQYQLATQGPNVTIAGGASVIHAFPESTNDNLMPAHPIMAGLPAVLNGNSANHGYLLGLPPSASVLTQTSASLLPTTAEYDFGSGTIIATGMTWEFLYFNGFNSGPMLFNAVAYSLSIAGVNWLSAAPTSGVVPPGASTDIAVTFDAAGLSGGPYDASIRVSSNDPLTTVSTVAAHLDVTGAPDIVLSDSLFDYGPLFVGATAADTLTVTNQGTDILNVGFPPPANTDFTVNVPTINLSPGESGDVIVSFAPSTAGPATGTLFVASNDPDQPVINVALQGEGLLPPIIGVSPDSLVDSLLTNEISVQALAIDNIAGGRDLEWSIVITEVLDSVMIERDVSAAGGGNDPGSIRVGDAESRISIPRQNIPLAVYPALVGDRVLFDGFHSHWKPTQLFGLLAGELASQGYVVTESTTPLDVIDFMQVDVLVIASPTGGTSYSPAELNAIDNFVSTGGGLLLLGEGDGFWLERPALNAVGALFGVNYFPESEPSLDLTLVPHEITAGVVSVNYGFGSGLGGTFTSVGSVLSTDMLGVADAGGGRVVFFGDCNVFDDQGSNLFVGDNLQLATNIFAWLASAGPIWIDAQPLSGTVAPGLSTNVDVTFDATALLGGNYHAQLAIQNNDPLNPEVVVPAHLNVTGVPDIVLPTTALDFGSPFLGDSTQASFVVSNNGSDVLTVNLSSSSGDYAAAPAAFSVNPMDSQVVSMTFRPTSPGAIPATLTVTSNDPDEGSLAIALTGTGVIPPQVTVAPDSLGEALFSGDISQQTLTIGNPGGSALTFTINVLAAVDSLAAVSRGGIAPGGAIAMPNPRLSIQKPGRPSRRKPDVVSSEAESTPVSWLSVSPLGGTVNPGDSLDLTVTFDANGLVGGLLTTTIEIATNVPGTPVVSVPVELDVTGTPRIIVSDSLLAFGDVFIGYPQSMVLQVSNVGSDSLHVSSISASIGAVAASPSTFDLAIGGSQSVQVTFDPASAGAIAGVLSIASNDSTALTVAVDVTGNALVPPVIGTSVDSLVLVVPLGGARTDTVTIFNTGGSDLTWNVNVTAQVALAAAAVRGGNGTRGGGPAVSSDGDAHGPKRSTMGTFNVLWHGNHGLGDIALWSVIVGDITAGGATVTQSSAEITPALLSGIDVLWLGDRTVNFTAGETSAMVTWVSNGGALLIEADSDASSPIYNLLHNALGSGIFTSVVNGTGGITPNVHPHEMTSGVSQVTFLGPDSQAGVMAPASRLVDDLFSRPIIVFSEVGSGRVVHITDQPFHDVVINVTNNRLLANQVFNWLVQFSWLSVTPASGTVAPGASVDLVLTTDASLLPPGTFQKVVAISSNDPGTPTTEVPIRVTVDSVTVATAIGGDGPLPMKFDLGQNYPNPFNPTTTIRYELPKSVKTRLSIYNVKGEMIRELVNAQQAAGRYRVEWDGRSASGAPVASGVYFYKLVAGSFVQTKKMIMLK